MFGEGAMKRPRGYTAVATQWELALNHGNQCPLVSAGLLNANTSL